MKTNTITPLHTPPPMDHVIAPDDAQPVRTIAPLEEGRLYRARRRHDPEQTLTEKGLAWLGDRLGERAEERFLFDPNFLWQITRESVEDFPQRAFRRRGDCRQARFDHIIARLAERHPGRVETRPTWFLNRCGGAQFSAAFLHVSAWEYVLLCGSNVGLSGADSGTYATDVWDFIIEGENYNVGADPMEPVEVTRAGEYTFLGRGERKTWSMSAPCWMIDYARGFTPLMSPFGLAENLTVSTNPRATLRSGSRFLGMMAQEHRIRAGLSSPRGQSRTPWGATVKGRWFGRQDLRDPSPPALAPVEEPRLKVDREEWAPFAVVDGLEREDWPTLSWMKNTAATVAQVGRQRLSGLTAVFGGRSMASYSKMSVHPDPRGVWSSDASFCWARLCGPGIHNLRRATEAPPELRDADIQRATGDADDGVKRALERGRLYVMDLTLLSEAELVPGRRLDGVCAWFVTTEHVPERGLDLKAVAIALGAEPAEWVRPGDGARWSRAKIRAQVADATWALVYPHLAETHLYTEGFVVATRAALPGGPHGHPVRRLLDPHLDGTVFVNKMTRRFAMAEGSIVDSTLGGTRESLLGLVAQHIPTYDDQRDHRWLNEMTSGPAGGIRVHPGRDDSQALMDAIEEFVGAYVARHYPSDADVREDAALQRWAAAMVEVGAQLAGAPSHFPDRAALARALTHIIFTATVRHAATHYSMDDFMGRVADMPLSWRDEGEDLLSMLPAFGEALAQTDLTMVSCGVSTNERLGRYPEGWFDNDPATRRLVARFQQALDAISADIHARNQRLEAEGLWRYETLLPEQIPTGIT